MKEQIVDILKESKKALSVHEINDALNLSGVESFRELIKALKITYKKNINTILVKPFKTCSKIQNSLSIKAIKISTQTHIKQ